MLCSKLPRTACLLWPRRRLEALWICFAGDQAHGWRRKSPLRPWRRRSLRRSGRFGRAKGSLTISSHRMHRLRSRRLWISASGDRAQASQVRAKVINARVFPVEINLLTFFPIGCFLWVQFQSSFPHPRRALLPGSLSRCPGKLAQTENRARRADSMLRLLFLRVAPDSIEEDSRRTIQQLLFRFLRTLIPHFCGSCGRVEQGRGAFITMPLEVSPAPASAPGPDNCVAGGKLCFVLGLALLLLASCVLYRCRSLLSR